MGKYKNFVLPLIVPSGQSTKKITLQTEDGFIKRAVIVHGASANNGVVRALIKDATGDKLAELQPVEMFRSRDVQYKEDGVPLFVKGGTLMTFEIIATANFTADYQADLVLIYEEEENCG